jgi:hypothetical protein
MDEGQSWARNMQNAPQARQHILGLSKNPRMSDELSVCLQLIGPFSMVCSRRQGMHSRL